MIFAAGVDFRKIIIILSCYMEDFKTYLSAQQVGGLASLNGGQVVVASGASNLGAHGLLYDPNADTFATKSNSKNDFIYTGSEPEGLAVTDVASIVGVVECLDEPQDNTWHVACAPVVDACSGTQGSFTVFHDASESEYKFDDSYGGKHYYTVSEDSLCDQYAESISDYSFTSGELKVALVASDIEARGFEPLLLIHKSEVQLERYCVDKGWRYQIL